MAEVETRAEEMLVLNELLDRLAELDERLARVVELRVFVRLTVEETAVVLEASTSSVERWWALARAWLQREAADGSAESSES